jgi:hypothetical protein
MGIKDTKFQGHIKQKLGEGYADLDLVRLFVISMDINTVSIIN